ncbi:MAG: 50S ribosomal protein L13 [Thermodesulfobacteriota bacterium]|nr:MAG: 50S ribosomal protein L13 [Candidatus Dadabacteria bacterium]
MNQKQWLLFDAKDKIVGRLASKVANMLIGKNKSSYTPGTDNGDFVIIVNTNELKFSGKKLEHKYYYRNTGYPGGLRSVKAADLMEKDSTEVLKKAVKGMLPKNKWQSVLMNRLKVYKNSDHPHGAQNPKAIEV